MSITIVSPVSTRAIVPPGALRPAGRRLGGDVAYRQARGATGEAPVGDQRAGPAEPLALEEARRVQHLLHARSAPRAFVPDDHHVARDDLAVEDSLHRVVLALEHN